MIKKLTVAVIVIVIASLSIAGCIQIGPTASPSPSPSPSPTATLEPRNIAAELTAAWEACNSYMERPFTKSINARGNDIYKGVSRNATPPRAKRVTVVVKSTKSQAEAKTLYNIEVATEQNEGFVLNPTDVEYVNANPCQGCTEVWCGIKYPDVSLCFCQYLPQFGSRTVVTETMSAA